MGLLGHFVADVSQPLHNSSNYDGWENGHGGIHSYYEEGIVVHLGTNLLSQIIKNAPAIAKELDLSPKSTTTEKMKKLSILTYKDLDQIWSMDPIEKKSSKTETKGLTIKESAKRTSPEKVVKKFEPLILKHMTRSSVLLAYLWDQIYIESQTPNLNLYKSYRFPLQPDFVEPDYIKNSITK
jgi:hypothetical protein